MDCADEPAGHGVGVYGGSHVLLRRFALEDSALCGLQLAAGGSADLFDGSFERNSIGACVQVEDYDLSRLTERVSFGEHQSIESTHLPIPEPGPSLD